MLRNSAFIGKDGCMRVCGVQQGRGIIGGVVQRSNCQTAVAETEGRHQKLLFWCIKRCLVWKRSNANHQRTLGTALQQDNRCATYSKAELFGGGSSLKEK